MKKLSYFMLASIVMTLASCNDETSLNEKEKSHQVKEEILSLESAKSAEDFLKVYEHIVTEQDYLDAMEILAKNNKTHLLEQLATGGETITLRSGAVVEKNNDYYYYQGDILLTQEDLDLLANPNLDLLANPNLDFKPFVIDKENPLESLYAAMNERFPNVEFPDFEAIEKTVEEYENNGGDVRSEMRTRGAALIVVPCMNYIWSGDCPYVISNSMMAEIGVSEKMAIQDAINTWNSHYNTTGIRLVERTNQNDYIEFVYSNQNASHRGRKGGKQKLELKKHAFVTGTVIHELGHAFGLLHEQCKENRDKYVKIHWNNIIEDKKHNFEKQATNCAQFATFDFGSIMLYDNYSYATPFAEANHLPTLTRNDAAQSTWIENRTTLSQDDINIIPRMKELSVMATYVWIMTGGR